MQQVSNYIKSPVTSAKVADMWFVCKVAKFQELLKGLHFFFFKNIN